MSDLDILLWAAGAPVTPNEPPSDHVMLCDLAAAHRLVDRLLWRARTEQPCWCTKSLLGALACRSNGIRRRISKQMVALRELQERLPGIANPIVLVKGFAARAVMNDSRFGYASGDMDLLCADLQSARHALLGLGYREQQCFASHEYAALVRGEIVFELHHYLPVESYPLEARERTGVAEPFSGIEVMGDPPFQRLGLTDLMEDVRETSTGECCDLVFSGPATTAFIECAHLYRDFSQFACSGRIGVRLGSLAAIRALCEHSAFNLPRFERLIARLNGKDTIALVGDLIMRVYGGLPANWPTIDDECRAFPRDLFWRTHWTTQLSDMSTLIHPTEGGAEMIQRVGANSIDATEDAERTFCISATDGHAGAIRRFVRALTPNRLPFEFSVFQRKGQVSVRVRLRTEFLMPMFGFDAILFVPALYPYWKHRETFELRAQCDATRSPECLNYEFVLPAYCVDSHKRTVTGLLQVARRPVDSVVGTPAADLIVTVPLIITLTDVHTTSATPTSDPRFEYTDQKFEQSR